MSYLTRHRARVARSLSAAAGLLVLASACSDEPTNIHSPARPATSVGDFGKPRSVLTRGRIVFSTTTTGDQEIYSINEDGSGLVRLTYHDGFDSRPAASPDGKKIVFVSRRDDAVNLYVMNADGSGVKQITSFDDPNLSAVTAPTWSPDGRKIAFSRIVSNSETAIFVTGANGGSIAQLTSGTGFNDVPAWSPDGASIAFVRFDPFTTGLLQHITVMNADGSNAAPLFECASFCGRPDWSPDGKQIAYSIGTGIHRFVLATKQDGLMVEGGLGPSWSPDGLKLAYTSSEGDRQLSVINADGSNAKSITTLTNSVIGQDADWARAP